MGVEHLVFILVAFMLVSVLIAAETRDLLSSVISLGAAGFALSVIDLLLGAPDLAITQVVVEVIAVVLLIRMVVTRKDTSVQTPRDTLRTALVLLAAGIVLVGLFFALGGHGAAGGVPAFGRPVLSHADSDAVPAGPGAHYLARSADETGVANVVMAVLIDYRGYDTLGEATIIFVAVLGTYALLRTTATRREELAP